MTNTLYENDAGRVTRGRANGKESLVADARLVGGGRKYFPATKKGEAEAKAFLQSVLSEKTKRGAYTNPNTTPTFGDALNKIDDNFMSAYERHARIQKLADESVKNVERDLKQLCDFEYGDKKLRDVRVGDLKPRRIQKAIRDELLDLYPWKTANNKWVHFKLMIDWLVAEEILAVTPIACKFPKEPEANQKPIDRMTKEKFEAILAAARNEDDCLVMRFAGLTGLRFSELAALTWPDLDLEKGYVIVNKKLIRGKVGVPKSRYGYRKIKIIESLRRQLIEYKLRKANTEYVFTDDEGLPFKSSEHLRRVVLHHAIKKANELAWRKQLAAGEVVPFTIIKSFEQLDSGQNVKGNTLTERGRDVIADRIYNAAPPLIEKIRWHDLRHYFASTMIFDTNLEGAIIQRLMGHHDYAYTIKQYGHWLNSPERDDMIAEQMERALS